MADEIDELRAALEARDKEIQAALVSLGDSLKGHSSMASQKFEALDKLLASENAINLRVQEIEQKLAGPRRGTEKRAQTWGDKVLAADGMKRLMAERQGSSGRIMLSDPLMAAGELGSGKTPATDGNAGFLITPDRRPEIIRDPRRPLTIRQLLRVSSTTSNSVEFVQKVAETNAAAPVAEHAVKPYSTWQFGDKAVPVRTIAHLAKASLQVLEDAPQLRDFVDGEMRDMLDEEEEDQILLGDGTGQNLLGLLPQATAYNTALTLEGMTDLDIVRRAALQVRQARFRPTAIVMGSLNYDNILGLKDTTGGYLFANPTGSDGLRLWGLPVVESVAMPANRFIVGAFRQAATIYDRSETSVVVATENTDDFERNRCTFRCEKRLALAVTHPKSLVAGTFPTTP